MVEAQVKFEKAKSEIAEGQMRKREAEYAMKEATLKMRRSQ